MKPRDYLAPYSIFTADLSLPEAGLYFYRFEILNKADIYFCGRDKNGCAIIGDWLPEWQLTVYEKDFKTPSWFYGGVMYQIFPDRFCKGRTPDLSGITKDYVMRKDSDGVPEFARDKNGNMKTNDFFGGNLDGIRSKLPYLKALGVTCIYLNPIFEAYSNHKYDTADYMKIDPMFGTEKDFRRLCSEARKHGIHIILDGVFSHTGCDSVYFNKYGRYGKGGAYRDKSSPYYNWYTFKAWPDDYDCWWGVKILPNVKELEPSFLDFITGKNGVIKHWLRAGAHGFRLDVADELPDEFIKLLRRSLKEEKNDALLIGEVWEDASNKISYGTRRKFLEGQELDSVMNYPFKDAIIDFVLKGDAESFAVKIYDILNNYPEPATNCLMNILGTHDTVRILTVLSGADIEGMTREQRAYYKLSEEEYSKGKKLLILAAVLQFTLPGVPCIYYGDEAGLYGFEDPFNRRFYPWDKEDNELIEFYKLLGNIRKGFKKVFCGDFEIIKKSDNVIIYSRGHRIFTAANAGEKETKIKLPGGKYINLLTGKGMPGDFLLNPKAAIIAIKK